MKKDFVETWKKSTQPRKQRKYRANAPKHVKNNFIRAPLSKELREEHGTKNIRVRVGDKAVVTRGQHSGTEGEVARIDMKREQVYLDALTEQRPDGSAQSTPVHPSNLKITSLDTTDETRIKS